MDIATFRDLSREDMYTELRKKDPTAATGHTRSSKTELIKLFVGRKPDRRGNPHAQLKIQCARRINSLLAAPRMSKSVERKVGKLVDATRERGLKPAKHLLLLKAIYMIEPRELKRAKKLRMTFKPNLFNDGVKSIHDLGRLHNFDWNLLGKSFVVTPKGTADA